MRRINDFQKVGWGIHGGGNDCGCHRTDERLAYGPGQMNALLRKVEQMGENSSIGVVELFGKRQNDVLLSPAAQCKFVYNGQTVETVACLHDGVNGTLVFCNIFDETEDEKLYWIVGRTILNIWDIENAPEWTKYWTTKSQVEALQRQDEVDLSGYEVTENKVTTIRNWDATRQGNNYAEDVKYPSERAVAEAINLISEDITRHVPQWDDNNTSPDSGENTKNLPNIDARYGPYLSKNAAVSILEQKDLICNGLTVGIVEGNKIVEYWFQSLDSGWKQNGVNPIDYLVAKQGGIMIWGIL